MGLFRTLGSLGRRDFQRAGNSGVKGEIQPARDYAGRVHQLLYGDYKITKTNRAQIRPLETFLLQMVFLLGSPKIRQNVLFREIPEKDVLSNQMIRFQNCRYCLSVPYLSIHNLYHQIAQRPLFQGQELPFIWLRLCSMKVPRQI